ncbi:hypothetical protein [Peptacetobacter hiranonis]|uniref:hypothetical protein n=1 Tax=Peptacetobacter hiranonis TaxID=89152 RepID=UPI003D815C14
MTNKEILFDIYKHILYISDSFETLLEAYLKKDIYLMDSKLRFIKWCILDLEEEYIGILSDGVLCIRNINTNELDDREKRDYNYLINVYKIYKESFIDKLECKSPSKDKDTIIDGTTELKIKEGIDMYKEISKDAEIQMKRLNSDY